MNKAEFIRHLEQGLEGLPPVEIKKTLSYYSELISDHMDEGMSEEEAVASLGSPEDIIREIKMDLPFSTLVKTRSTKNKRSMRAWEIILIILGMPLWLPILLAILGVIIAVYMCIWAAIITLFALVIAMLACGVAIIVGLIFMFSSHFLSGLFIFGVSLACVGCGIVLFFVAKKLTVWLIKLTGAGLRRLKACFIRKEQC